MVRVTKPDPCESLPGSHDRIVISRERVARNVERLRSTTWKDVRTAFCSFDLSKEALFCLNAVKESRVLWFEVAASDFGISLDLLSLIQEIAVKAGLPRKDLEP